MADKMKIVLTIANTIISLPHRLFLTTVPGTGYMCDRLNGQVVCPKCLSHGFVSYMMYDGHFDIQDRPADETCKFIPGCATDRFICTTCNHIHCFDGAIGRKLNKRNPFKIITLPYVLRRILIYARKAWHTKRFRRSDDRKNNQPKGETK